MTTKCHQRGVTAFPSDLRFASEAYFRILYVMPESSLGSGSSVSYRHILGLRNGSRLLESYAIVVGVFRGRSEVKIREGEVHIYLRSLLR